MTDTTPALDALAGLGVAFTTVRTERAHSAEESAAMQGVPLGALLRTIVVRRGEDDYVFVLVPGGRRFDWAKRRRPPPVTRGAPSRRSGPRARGRSSRTRPSLAFRSSRSAAERTA
jgi:hypothetical protein